jgi:branched-chain amino acid transport system substrate-binding protein
MTKLTRQQFLRTAAAAVAAGLAAPALAQQREIAIGAVYPLSGAAAAVGVDCRIAIETAVALINEASAIDVPMARDAGLPALGGAKIRVVFADHQGDPQRGRAEAERLITQEHVVALVGTYQSAVAVTVSQIAERYDIPFLSLDNSSPSLHRRGLRTYFRTSAHDETFSEAMFDFIRDLKARNNVNIETASLFYEDTIFGTDSSNVQRRLAGERGIRVLADIKYRNSTPSLTAEVQQLKAANAQLLLPSSYTNDAILLIRTMAELGYQPQGIIAQDAGFSEQAFIDAVGPRANGIFSRSSFSLDLGERRPSVNQVNALFKARSNKDLNDVTARDVMGMLVLADAINRAGATEPAAIMTALRATDIPGERTIMPWRRVHFDAQGQNDSATPVILQIVGGRYRTVWPFEVASEQVTWPLPQR